MNEETESFWKKPLRGVRGTLLAFAILAAALFVLAISFGWTDPGLQRLPDLLLFALVTSVSLALFAMLAVVGIRWVCSWRNFRRLMFFIACFVTLVVLFYAEENLRGKWAWEKYQRTMEARGLKLDPSAYIPASVPDDQNFAMTPLLAPLFDFEPGTQKWRDTNALRRIQDIAPRYSKADKILATAQDSMGPNSWVTGSNSWVRGQTDLPAWHVALLKSGTNKSDEIPEVSTNLSRVASGILEILADEDPVLRELRTAAARPYSRFNLRYETDNPADVVLPHLAVCKRICQVLQLRASAELALGRNDAALDDILLILRLAETAHAEPTLIAHLVCTAEMQIALQAISEGLDARQWTESQLRTVQRRLEGFDFIAGGQAGLTAERVLFGGGVIDYLRRESNKYQAFISLGFSDGQSNGSEKVAAPAIAVAPSGWLYLEKLNYNRAFDDYLTAMIDVESRRVSPEACRKADARLKELCDSGRPGLFLQHRIMSALLLPALPNVAKKTARAQAGLDAIVLACALERYRLARGEFPETLDALAPDYVARIPHDVINGQPWHYRRVGAQFVLYSVGWDEADDGGRPGLREVNSGFREANSSTNRETGDWVWASQ
jgi:hypothetical protein